MVSCARECAWVLVALVVCALHFSAGQIAFPDTCACPDAAPCPSFCLTCNKYNSECTSGKTHAKCNCVNSISCPSGYDKRSQTGQSWSCTACGTLGGGYQTMYHCHRFCYNITTGKCDKCQDGYYNYNNNQTCNACPAGDYCSGGVDQGLCSLGHYCLAGSASPTDAPCPAGTYGATRGQKSPTCSGQCDPGYYCSTGSTSSNQFPCSAGQWGSSGQTNAFCSGKCAAGYYCPAASNSSTQAACGNATRYCPAGSAVPLVVDAGFYTTPETGSAANRTGESICLKGSYCTGGLRLPCPAGTYSSSIGSESCAANQCLAGSFCPDGSTSPTAGLCYPDPLNPPVWPATYYCPAGTPAPQLVLPGYYTTPESAPATQRTGQALADPALYVVSNGLRLLKVAWGGVCTGNSGQVSVTEWINDGSNSGASASPDSVVTELSVYDNVALQALGASKFAFYEAGLAASINDDRCVSLVAQQGLPFTLSTRNGVPSLLVKNATHINYEQCAQYVLRIVATAIAGGVSSTCTLTVTVLNSNDIPYFETQLTQGYPRAAPATTQFHVVERAVLNTAIGLPIPAADEDVGQETFFSILADLDGALGMFYIGSCSGQIYVQLAGLDHRAKPSYALQVRVCDDPRFFGQNSAQCSVNASITIFVDDVNDQPLFRGTPYVVSSFRIPENSPPRTLLEPWCINTTDTTVGGAQEQSCASLLGQAAPTGLVVDDLDLNAGESLTNVMQYSVSRNDASAFAVVNCERASNLATCKVGDPATATANASAGALFVSDDAVLNYEMRSLYSITVRVDDTQGASALRDVAVVVTNANDAPTWPQSSAFELAFNENDPAASGTIFAFDEDADDRLAFTVHAVYNAQGVAQAQGSPPLFRLSPASGVRDSEPVTLSLAAGSTLDYENSTMWTVTVRANDLGGLYSDDRNVTVAVLDVNEAPYLLAPLSGQAFLNVSENSAIGAELSEPLRAGDPDHGQLAFFNLLPVLDASLFAVATVTGDVSVRGLLNFETQRNYTIRVTVIDNGDPSLSSTSDVVINVLDVPEPPAFPAAGQTFSFVEGASLNASWVQDVQVADQDADDTVTVEILWQNITATGAAVCFFAVDGAGLLPQLVQNASCGTIPDYESPLFAGSADHSVTLRLRATDSTGLRAEANVAVQIANANDRPVLLNASTSVPKHVSSQFNCTEDMYCQPGYVVLDVYALCADQDIGNSERQSRETYAIVSGNDGGTFRLTQGVLVVDANTEELRQAGHVFTLVVTATDDGSPSLTSDPATVVVTVSESNYPPKIHDLAVNISEADNVTRVLCTSSDMGAWDPDNSTLVYELVECTPSAATASLSIDASTGALTQMRPVDFETQSLNGTTACKVRVRDNGGDQTASSLSASALVMIRVADVNELPAFGAATYSVQVYENAAAGALPVQAVASDPDAADAGRLAYALIGDSTGFSINSASGQVSQDGAFNFESPRGACQLRGGVHTCSLMLRVSDSAGQVAEAALSVEVLNVNEPPAFSNVTCQALASGGSISSCSVNQTSHDLRISLPENAFSGGSVRVAKLSATDADAVGGTRTPFASALFFFSGDDAEGLVGGQTGELGLFSLDVDGNLFLVGPLDFENRSEYALNVSVSDQGQGSQGALTANAVLRISVGDVNDLPVVTASTTGPWPTAGGSAVVLAGSNFGSTSFKTAAVGAASYPVARTFLVAPQGPSLEATGCSVTSDTRIDCAASPAGVGASWVWQVELTTLAGSVWRSPADFSAPGLGNRFAAPVVVSVANATALPTVGGQRLGLLGANFGLGFGSTLDVQVSYRSRLTNIVRVATGCAVAAFNASLQQITCTSVPSTGPRLEFMVQVQSQDAQAWFFDETFAHAAPSVSSVQLADGAPLMRTGGGSGGVYGTGLDPDAIVLRGSNFGAVSMATIAVTFGPSGLRYSALGCRVTVAHTEIRCGYPAGAGSGLAFVAVVDSVASPPSAATLGYAGPRVSKISGPGAENGRTKGGDVVLIAGSGFGPADAVRNPVLATYGGPNATKYAAAMCTVTVPDVQITCHSSSGTGRNHRWVVAVSDQLSDPTDGSVGLGSSYANPTLNFFEGAWMDACTEGGAKVRLVGVDFGADSSLVSATFGPTGFEYQAIDCTIDPENLDTHMTCTLPPGVGARNKWTVYVDGQMSKVPTTDYIKPSILQLSGACVNDGAHTAGGEELLISGLDFGPLLLYDGSHVPLATPGSGNSSAMPALRFTYGPVTGEEYEAMGCVVLDLDVLTSIEITARAGPAYESGASVDPAGSFALNYALANNTIVRMTLSANASAAQVKAMLEEESEPMRRAFCSSKSRSTDSGATCQPVYNVTRSKFFEVTGDGASWAGGYTWTITSTALPVEKVTGMSPPSLLDGGGGLSSGLVTVVTRQPGKSQVRCRTSAGVGADLRVLAHAANQNSLLSGSTFSYRPPSITSLDPAVGVSSASFVLRINGNDFGSGNGTATVYLSDRALPIVSASHTAITVSVPHELQRNANNTLRVMVGGQMVESRYSFLAPNVTSIVATNPPQVLSGPPQEILIRGRGFGVQTDLSADLVTIGGQPCNVSVWAFDHIVCNVTVLSGPMLVKLGQQQCKAADGRACCPCDFSYEALLTSPVVTSISRCGVQRTAGDNAPPQCSTAGGFNMTVYGKDLGSYLNGHVMVGDNKCVVSNGVESYLDSEITCEVPEGEGSQEVVVHNAWKRSRDSTWFHYDAPRLSGLSPAQGPTRGGINVTVSGQNLGLHPEIDFWMLPVASSASDSASADRVACSVLARTHDEVVCTLPEGEGRVRVGVVVANQTSPSLLNFSYNVPAVQAVQPQHGGTDGNFTLTVIGADFGRAGSGRVLVGGRECAVLAWSHGSINCTAPAGAGVSQAVVVSTGLRSSNADVTFSYDPPLLFTAEPLHGPTDGGTTVYITGANLGQTNLTTSVDMGGWPCTGVNVTSSSQLKCQSPIGVGVGLPVNVTVGGQSLPADQGRVGGLPMILFDFDAPALSNVKPWPVNALGDNITITGANFGSQLTDPGGEVRVVVGDDDNATAAARCAGAQRDGDRSLRCSLPALRVGRHPVSVTAVSRSASLASNAQSGLFAVCRQGFYGQDGELCRACPPGAECLGYVNEWNHDPEPLPRWGQLNRSLFQPCEPGHACLGNNTCEVGYKHKAAWLRLCGVCEPGFYRLGPDCVACPSMAWLVLVLCVLFATMLCSLAYFLTKHGVQLAAVSICIDFCQVVSLFSSYDFAWPPVVHGAYSVMSAFNLNLDLASPECSVGWDYHTKWNIMYFMPVTFGALFMSGFVYAFVRKLCKDLGKRVREYKQVTPNQQLEEIRGGTSFNHSHSSSARQESLREILQRGASQTFVKEEHEKVLLVDGDDIAAYDAGFNRFIDAEFGAFLIMCYYLYLSIMRKCFETFRCTDGAVPLLRADPSEPCTEQGEYYPTMHSLAVLGVFVYGVGIPVVISYLLSKHRDFIQQDQRRRERALAVSDSDAATRLQSAFRGYYVRKVVDPCAILRRHKQLTNIGRTRAKYGKLYEDFSSECYYWRVVLMLRKLVLVMITMFLDDKFKQSTLAFAVLFTSYAVQVQKRPYLSRFPDDREKRKRIKAYLVWKKRAEMRNQIQKSEGRLKQLRMAMRDRLVKAGSKIGVDLDSQPRDSKENMDFRHLEISRKAREILQAWREAERSTLSEVERQKEAARPAVERRWRLIRKFVTEMDDQDKFQLSDVADKDLHSDALRWLFDYNTLEMISLAALMYMLLFGLLFDSYSALGNSAGIHFLAAFMIAGFCFIISIFCSSVVIDMYRKFLPVVRRTLVDGVWGAFARVVLRRQHQVQPAPVKKMSARVADEVTAVLAPKHGQWVSPVNPFATLAKQNADLVLAEEARLQAIMSSKARHQAELAERERKRAEEKQHFDDEYRVRMDAVDAELRELESLQREQDQAVEREVARALEKESAFIEEELSVAMEKAGAKLSDAELKAILDASEETPEQRDKREAESAARRKLIEEEQFRAEHGALLAREEADKMEHLAVLRTRQAQQVGEMMAELEMLSSSVASTHRAQGEEIKARLQERRLTVKPAKLRPRRGDPQDEIEARLFAQEDKVGGTIDANLDETRAAELQHGQKVQALVADLRESVKAEVGQALAADAEFEAKAAQELRELDEALERSKAGLTLRLESEVAELQHLEPVDQDGNKLTGAALQQAREEAAKHLRADYDAAIAKLTTDRAAERTAAQERLAALRVARAQDLRDGEERREAQRVAEIDAAAKKEERARLQALEVTLKEEAALLPRDEADRLRQEYESASQALKERLATTKSEGRAALERRLEQRQLEQAATEAEKKRERDAAVAAAATANAAQAQAAAGATDKTLGKGGKQSALGADASADEVAAELERIKQESIAKKAELEAKIRNDKSNQRDKMRERLSRKLKQAEEKKASVLAQKASEEREMESKLNQEDNELRAKQAKEIADIETAQIDVFLDDKQAKDLAEGVEEWRKRKQEMADKAKRDSAPKRSDMIAADFSAKADRIDKLKADAAADKAKQQEMAKLVKELQGLYSHLIEEMDAEMNKMTNDAAVLKARQKRRLDTLAGVVASSQAAGASPKSPASPASPASKDSGRDAAVRKPEAAGKRQSVQLNLDKLAFGKL
jgi:hypothetical protein